MQSLALRASHFSLHFSQKYCEKRKIDYANNFLQGLAFLRKKHNFKLTLVRKIHPNLPDFGPPGVL